MPSRLLIMDEVAIRHEDISIVSIVKLPFQQSLNIMVLVTPLLPLICYM